jgi:hypothetical protein
MRVFLLSLKFDTCYWGGLLFPEGGGGSVLGAGAGSVVAGSGAVVFGAFGLAGGRGALVEPSSAGTTGVVGCFALTGAPVSDFCPVLSAAASLSCSGVLPTAVLPSAGGLVAGVCATAGLGRGAYFGSTTAWPGVNALAGGAELGVK